MRAWGPRATLRERGIRDVSAGGDEVMAPNIEWTPAVRRTFLDLIASSAIVTTAAETAGVSRAHAYRLREADPEFRALWDTAVATANERLRAEAWRRGVVGVKEPVGFYMGKHGGVFVRRYSDRLLEKLLSAAYPDEFRENVHHSGDATGGLAAQLARALDRRNG